MMDDDRVARLRWIEARLRVISERRHALTREHEFLVDQRLRTRLTLSADEAVAYERG